MPSLSRDIVEAQLETKFGLSQEVSDHRKYRVIIQGRKVAGTMVSTGTSAKVIPKNLVSKMARDLKVDTAFFVEMMSCTKSRDDYYDELRNRGILE